MSKRSNKRKRSASRGKTPRPDATPETIAWRSAVQQVLREGKPVQIAARLADRRAQGQITSSVNEYEKDEEDRENEEATDAEIDLHDEDESRDEDFDENPHIFVGLPRRPGEGLFTDQDPTQQGFEFVLRIHNGKCFLVRPRWGGGEASARAGEEDLSDLGKRLALFQAVGDWLERERSEFLNYPEPMLLGINALKEMEMGLPSVSPGAFLQLSKIDALISALSGKELKAKSIESIFSRHIQWCHLEWTDGSGCLSLDFLFGSNARKAWVASAIMQAAQEFGMPLTKERLEKYKSLTIPKEADEKERLMGTNVASLNFPDFIRRANRMAGTNWSEVISGFLLNRVS